MYLFMYRDREVIGVLNICIEIGKLIEYLFMYRDREVIECT